MISRGAASERGWLVVLVLLLGFAIGSDCTTSSEGKLASPPSFAGLLQEFETLVDDLADGSIDASDAGSTTGGPGALSTSTSLHSVSLASESDSDTILAHCEHTLSPGTSETGCMAIIRASFDVAEAGTTEFYVEATRTPGETLAPTGLSSSLEGVVSIDCVTDSTTDSVNNPTSFFETTSRTILVNTQLGDACAVTIQMTASVTTSGLATPTSFIQTVSVTVPTSTTPDCTRASQCPAETPFCDANGSCGTGDEGQPANVVVEDCMAEFISSFGCSHGVSGSVCRGDFECTDGYDCSGLGVCVGQTPCVSDLDCSPPADICTEQGTCSPYGEQGEGCVTGDFCRQGLICLSNRCTVLIGQGEDCTLPNTVCDGLACFPSTGTCEAPRPLGSSCTDNVECEDSPAFNSCNQAVGGVCTVRQSSGGPCTQNLDCAGFQGCDLGTNTCN